MKIDNKLRLIAGLCAVMTVQVLPGAVAKPKPKALTPITYDVVHAIPQGFGADIVDIYANGSLVVDNATPGAMKAITGERGAVTLEIYANGVVPGPTTKPLLTAGPVYLSTNSKYSFVAHLSAKEEAHFSVFRNMTTEAGSKRSWLIVRHVAAAPDVNIRINSERVFIPLSNGYERKKSLTFDTYALTAALTDTPTAVVGPYSVTLKRGTNVILYIWGAKSKGNLAFLKEEVPAR